ncbi:cysteine hydrolase family protein [Paenibacillus tarimensis]
MSAYTLPDWCKSALITLDTQNDFTLPGAPAEIIGTYEILPFLKELLQVYRKAGLPVIHVVRLYKEDGSNVDICRREAIEKGTRIVAPMSPGANLVEKIQPDHRVEVDSDVLLKGDFQQIASNEWIMYKPRWGAFYQTNLEPFLRDKNINTIVFSGCNFPNCPRTSIYEASERDYRIVLVSDAVSGLYEKGIEEMINIGVNVLQTDVIKSIITETSP